MVSHTFHPIIMLEMIVPLCRRFQKGAVCSKRAAESNCGWVNKTYSDTHVVWTFHAPLSELIRSACSTMS